MKLQLKYRRVRTGTKDRPVLPEGDQKFRLLADHLPQLIWTGDADGNLNYFSKAVYDFSGLQRKEIIGGGWMDILHPDDLANNLAHWNHSIETGDDFTIEHRFRRHDGEYRWMLSRAVAQRDQMGHVVLWVGTSTDIHDQKA